MRRLSMTLLFLAPAVVADSGCAASARSTASPPPSIAAPSGPMVSRADSLRTAAQYDSAIALYQRELVSDPRSSGALYGLALAHMARALGRALPAAWYDTALVAGERLLPIDSALGLRAVGLARMRRGDHALGLVALGAAARRDSTSADAALDLGSSFFALGQHYDAVPWLERAARLRPGMTAPLNLLGFAYFHVGLLDTAAATFGHALQRAPNATSVGGVALVRIARGDLEGAITFADSAARANHNTPAYLARLGEAYLFAGRWAEAEQAQVTAFASAGRSINQYTQRPVTLTLAFLARRAGRQPRADSLAAMSYAFADERLAAGIEPWNFLYQYACLSVLSGDRSSAHRWLLAAYQAGMPGPVLMERDPLLADLRTDPAFSALVERLRVREAEYRRRMR